jgi:hypothetical protein
MSQGRLTAIAAAIISQALSGRANGIQLDQHQDIARVVVRALRVWRRVHVLDDWMRAKHGEVWLLVQACDADEDCHAWVAITHSQRAANASMQACKTDST